MRSVVESKRNFFQFNSALLPPLVLSAPSPHKVRCKIFLLTSWCRTNKHILNKMRPPLFTSVIKRTFNRVSALALIKAHQRQTNVCLDSCLLPVTNDLGPYPYFSGEEWFYYHFYLALISPPIRYHE